FWEFDLRSELSRHPPHRGPVDCPDHLERGPDGRAEEGALQGDRRRARGHTQPSSRGRLYWPRRGQKGELVLWRWRRAIRLTYWQMRQLPLESCCSISRCMLLAWNE